jgi:predicted ester cyclase
VSLEENKTVIRRWIEAANNKDLAVLYGLLAEDYSDPSLQVRGRESYKQLWTKFFKGFPDWHETIENITAEGNRVWVFEKVTATHTGEFEFSGSTFPPTGKKVTIKSANIWRIVNGKVAEKESSVSDLIDFCTQLGVIETTEKAKGLFPK